MNRNKTIALSKLADIIGEFGLNSQITESVETGEPFIIIEEWRELGIIQRELNRAMAPKFFYKHYIEYLNTKGNDAFQDMRIEHNGWYITPTGLNTLDHWFDWGFHDEYMICENCGRSFQYSHSSYDDIPRWALIDGLGIFCHECIRDEFEEEYIESVTNNPEQALKLTIIDEKRLIELGWTEPEPNEEYRNGLHQGMNDKPIDIYNKLKNKYDVIFTLIPSQFYIAFWAWVKPKQITEIEE